ncbi:MAG: DUF116 domain-containing protein [Deltaproteobacteria bacterium]|nr:DUF116 domain-containing protein [Deltaproteobacteria bacterium]
MEAITYSIASDGFYDELSDFTDTVLTRAREILPSVRPFMLVVDEKRRSENEYLLELMMLGVYWRNYASYAMGTTPQTMALCRQLLRARQIGRIKPVIDKVRGVVHTAGLMRECFTASPDLTLTNMDRLVNWLGASGDFKEESLRLATWRDYLRTQPDVIVTETLHATQRFAQWFETAGANTLGKYTANVNGFRHNVLQHYMYREDIILCSRRESDYHLIMVGAEIMNRGLKNQFQICKERIVLLPACMRPRHHQCQGKVNGHEISCTGCSSQCEIGAIYRKAAGAFEVRVIVHASNFTSALTKWQNQSEVGLVASACILHLFTGGYEMQKLNIPAQCVFLDYCGCKGHWHRDGIPTSVNMQQLFSITHPYKVKTNQANTHQAI